MFWWFGAGLANKVTVTLTLTLRLRFQAQSQAILSGIPTALPPLSYTHSPLGDVLMANGIIPMAKWNGIRLSARNVGVPAPILAPLLAGHSSGAITGLYQVYQRFIDDDNNPSNLSPVSNTLDIATTAGRAFLTASNLDIPNVPKIVRRQILRNTAGQLLTFYAEIDTTDMGATSFTLSLDDNTLATKEAVPLFDASNQPLANRYGIPPSWMRSIAAHRDRCFACGATSYAEGSIELTNGSTLVQGIGTAWIGSFVGRLFYVQGDPTAYQIAAVGLLTQTITLAVPYPGASTFFGTYKISPAPLEKNAVYFTEAGLFDAWSPSNVLYIEENGDENVAVISSESFLYIIQRRHTFRLSYLNSPFPSPVGDGAIFPSITRGTVNQASCVQVDDDIYTLDEQGVYSSSGNSVEPLSEAIQNLFWLDRTDLLATEDYRVNWTAREFFHGQLNYQETTIRWYVALSGDRQPQHNIAYNYRSKQWWIEEYAYPIGGSGQSLEAQSHPLLCGPSKKVFFSGVNTTDGADVAAGTTRGQVASATRTSITDTTAAFASTGLIGEPIVIYDGAGKTETRIIASVVGQVLNVTQPWTIQPDSTSDYQLGGIPWRWRSGWYRWQHGIEGESENTRRFELQFEPCASPAQMDMRLYVDHSDTPRVWQQNYPLTPKESTGVQFAKGSPDIVVDLDTGNGYAQARMDNHRDQFLNQGDWISLEMRGVSSRNVIRIYEVTIEGAS